jgi:hypothetical protein
MVGFLANDRLRPTAETLDILECKRIVRLDVKAVLVGEDTIVIPFLPVRLKPISAFVLPCILQNLHALRREASGDFVHDLPTFWARSTNQCLTLRRNLDEPVNPRHCDDVFALLTNKNGSDCCTLHSSAFVSCNVNLVIQAPM